MILNDDCSIDICNFDVVVGGGEYSIYLFRQLDRKFPLGLYHTFDGAPNCRSTKREIRYFSALGGEFSLLYNDQFHFQKLPCFPVKT